MSKSFANEELVSSPCIAICALDKNDICTGCYRSASEITSWVQMTREEKINTIRLALDREKKAGLSS
ncbi:MAG: putative Fe-S protein YdhL (DUF1289 family) [Cellvibrionaceae bacterium]|jgi:predicted Fe-S protein YdhL (DUF1289 family)